MSVTTYTTAGNSFAAEKPRLWSERRLSNLINTSKNIDLAPNGKRFAVILPVEQAGPKAPAAPAAPCPAPNCTILLPGRLAGPVA